MPLPETLDAVEASPHLNSLSAEEKIAKITAVKEKIFGLLCPTDPTKPSLAKEIERHKIVYPEIRAKDMMLEHLIHNVLQDNGVDDFWTSGSHAVSADMTLFDVPTSIKAGKYSTRKETLTFSGSRLTKHETIDDKLVHIKNSSADLYLCVAGKDGSGPDDPYYLMIFSSADFGYGSSENWVTTTQGWMYSSDIMDAKIIIKMSHQLWTVIKDLSNVFIHEIA